MSTSVLIDTIPDHQSSEEQVIDEEEESFTQVSSFESIHVSDLDYAISQLTEDSDSESEMLPPKTSEYKSSASCENKLTIDKSESLGTVNLTTSNFLQEKNVIDLLSEIPTTDGLNSVGGPLANNHKVRKSKAARDKGSLLVRTSSVDYSSDSSVSMTDPKANKKNRQVRGEYCDILKSYLHAESSSDNEIEVKSKEVKLW